MVGNREGVREGRERVGRDGKGREGWEGERVWGKGREARLGYSSRGPGLLVTPLRGWRLPAGRAGGVCE